MDTLWARITEKKEGKNWRNVYKGLLLLDYLLKNGSEKVVSETRARIYDLKQLGRFEYIDSTGVDRGLSVKERTKQIIDLAHDTERLKEERKNAKRNRGKFQGVGSEGVGHFASQDHFRRTDPYYGRDPSPAQKNAFMDDSDDSAPHGSTTKAKTTSRPKKAPAKGGDFFSSDSESEDSDKQSARRNVPQKEAWEPFEKRTTPQPQRPFMEEEDDEWGPMTPVAAPAPVTLPHIGGLQIDPKPVHSTPSPNLLLLTPTTPDAGTSGQTTFLSSTTPASLNIDKADPWAAGAHLFSLSAVDSGKPSNNFGATGSTFGSTGVAPSNFGSASNIPSTYPPGAYTGPPITGGYGVGGTTTTLPATYPYNNGGWGFVAAPPTTTGYGAYGVPTGY